MSKVFKKQKLQRSIKISSIPPKCINSDLLNLAILSIMIQSLHFPVALSDKINGIINNENNAELKLFDI